MTLTRFFTVELPSFHLVVGERAKQAQLVKELKKAAPARAYIAVMDGRAVAGKSDLMKAFAKALRFPHYFGYNWDALNECINDLAWLSASSYVLVLRDLDAMVLTDEDFANLVDILQHAAKEWNTGRTYNQSFPTPPTPFHAVLGARQSNSRWIIERLNSLGVRDVDVIS